jgi:hypothetical protein
MKLTKLFLIRLVLYSILLFTGTFAVVTAQNTTDTLVIKNDNNKVTVPIAKKKTHNPIRTPIIIVSTIICIALILGTFVFLQYRGKSLMICFLI